MTEASPSDNSPARIIDEITEAVDRVLNDAAAAGQYEGPKEIRPHEHAPPRPVTTTAVQPWPASETPRHIVLAANMTAAHNHIRDHMPTVNPRSRDVILVTVATGGRTIDRLRGEFIVHKAHGWQLPMALASVRQALNDLHVVDAA